MEAAVVPWLRVIAVFLALIAVAETWKAVQPMVLRFDRPVVVTIKYAEPGP